MKDIDGNKRPLILVVEDEALVAFDIRMRLERMGYKVAGITDSGEDAIQKAEALRPDLVLMDILLRGELDGIGAAHRIIRSYDIPIVFLTAYSDHSNLQRAKTTEPFGYLHKPFDDKDLMTAIELALYRHGIHNRLQESRQRFSAILHSIGDAVIATDQAGNVILINRVAEVLTGWSQGEAEGRALTEVFLPAPGPESGMLDALFQRVLRAELTEVCQNIRLQAVNGEDHMVEYSASAILPRDGACQGIVLVFRDITRKRMMEEEILKHKTLQSMSVLAGGIAHDFNNILSAILGNISLARMLAEPGSEVASILGDAEQASFRAKQLTQQLLSFAKEGTPVKKAAPIRELIQDAIRFALRGSGIRPQFSLEPELWPVDADEGQLSQVINNLIINAMQAMPDGGEIDVRAENVELPPESEVPVAPGRYVRLSIADEGIGIAPEDISRIFEPYFTTKEKGCGLGLAMCFAIVRNHKGHIWVEPQARGGTIFHLILPAAVTPPSSSAPPPEGPVHGSGRLLLMDDEAMVRDVTKRLLEKLGYEVTVVSSGGEAIRTYRVAREEGKPYDAVILDLTIPGGMSGREAMARIRAVDPDARVILSSGYAITPGEGLDDNAAALIPKPYDIAKLSLLLHGLLQRAETGDEQSPESPAADGSVPEVAP